jgi:putative SOS response-associated peptidase YedK
MVPSFRPIGISGILPTLRISCELLNLSLNVWPRPPFVRRQRDQDRVRHSAQRPTPNFAASWNVAPTDPLPVVRYDAKDRQRSLEVMRWGLVPFWAKDIKVGFANINAKAEGIENKPAFREAFRQRRCLVPVDNLYEWKKVDGGKQPYAIGLKGGGLMALAGLWETWRAPSSGERVRSFAIVTTEPNELYAALHNRMPVVLAPEAWPAWLGEEPAELPQLKTLLAPYPSKA